MGLPTSDYDRIGIGYSTTRQPDPRIASAICGALGNARSVVKVGAGTGSYEPVDGFLVAVEPSEVMVRQRPPDSAPAVQAVAERLPFADGTFDASLGGSGRVVTVPVPRDCRDGFCSAFWQRPEAYLDPRVRSGISYFSILDEDSVTAGLNRLSEDLASGEWDRRFGLLRQLGELDTGQRLIVAEV